jgi:hypothetical protein
MAWLQCSKLLRRTKRLILHGSQNNRMTRTFRVPPCLEKTVAYYPMTAATRATSETRSEGLLARMVRLWIEHYQRVIDLGIRPN